MGITTSAHALAYPAILKKDQDGRTLVRFKDFPECLTDGADEAEALLEAKDALSEAIVGRLVRGDDIPRPPAPKQRDRQIAPFPDAAMKLALRWAAEAEGVGASELARRLNVDEKEGRRILDPTFRTKPARMQQALGAVGQDMVITVRPIASRVTVMAKDGANPQGRSAGKGRAKTGQRVTVGTEHSS